MGKKKNVVPALTLDGFVDSPNLAMERLWVYFLTSAHSQSTMFRGTVKSFRYIIGTFRSASSIKQEMENALRELFSPFFKQVEATVDVVDYNRNGRLHLIIDVLCVDEYGLGFPLNKVINQSIGKFTNFEAELDRLYPLYKGVENGR